MHPSERQVISSLAGQKAQQVCNAGDDACVKAATVYWTDTLERTATGLVDDKASARNMQLAAAVLDASKNPDSQGARGGAAGYFSDQNEALRMLSPYMGQTISTDGVPATSYGSAQTYFSATPEQRADAYVNAFMGSIPGSIVPNMPLRDADHIANLRALNGSATPDYTVESVVLGGAIANRALGAIGAAISGMDVALAGKVTASEGGNISAQKITMEAVPVKLTTGEVGVLQKIDSLANTTLQGDAREYVSDSYFMRNGYTPMDGKCGVNCFDGVYTKNGQVFIAEVKPLNADGTIQLNGPNRITGLETQMSDKWIADTVETLKNSKNASQVQTAATIQAAIDNGNLVKVVTGVNQNGMVLVKLK